MSEGDQNQAPPAVPEAASLRPEDLVLKQPEKARRIAKPPKKVAPPWLKPLLTGLTGAALMLAIVVLVWRLLPENPFTPPPDSIKVVDVQVAEQDGLPVLQGSVSNASGRLARKVTFVVEYRLGGKDLSSFVVVQDVPDLQARPFSIPLVMQQSTDTAVIQPGKVPSLEGEPRFVPYDAQW